MEKIWAITVISDHVGSSSVKYISYPDYVGGTTEFKTLFTIKTKHYQHSSEKHGRVGGEG